LIPLKQFKAGGLHVIFYEHLCTQPEVEMKRLDAALNLPFSDLSLHYFNRPSTTTIQTSAILTGDDRLEVWRKKLTSEQVQNILEIVSSFGLSHLYEEKIIPNIKSDSLAETIMLG
jgi:hypothetical protein